MGEFRLSPAPDATGTIFTRAGATVSVNASHISDPDAGDELKLVVSWGDTEGTERAACGPCRLSHAYMQEGVFTLRAEVDDRRAVDRGTKMATWRVVVSGRVASGCGLSALIDFEGAAGLRMPFTLQGVTFTSTGSLPGGFVFTGFLASNLSGAWAAGGENDPSRHVTMTLSLPQAARAYSFAYVIQPPVAVAPTQHLRVEGRRGGAVVFTDTFTATLDPTSAGAYLHVGTAAGGGTEFDQLLVSAVEGMDIAIDNVSLTCN